MNKPSRIQTIAMAVVMALAVGVPIALAQTDDSGGAKRERRAQWRERGIRHDGGRGGAFFRNLDLTDAQKAQMKQIRESHSQSLRSLGTQIRAKRKEMRQASEGGVFNEALVTQKLNEIAPLEAKLMGERFRIHQEMLSVLTPEQKAKFDQGREQFKSKRGERRLNRQK